jgi:ABC-type transport system involved in multi-copper enzyme maturation permease subunit
MTKKVKPSWRTSFLAVVRYEILWNIRKKKFIGVFILAFAFPTLALALPVVFSNLNNQPIEPNPNYVIATGAGLGGLGFFLFALVTVMNSISGEFESGSIIPLLTKPVSRTTVYLGKISAALLTALGAYVLLTIYMAAGGYAIYGPQNNLHLIFITLLGSIMSTLVWMSIVLAAGSVTKSSMLAALLGIGVWFGLNMASGILSAFSNQAWIATYFPGSGASGTIGTPTPISPVNITVSTTTESISTGTDSIAANLITYILNSTVDVGFYRSEISGTGPGLVINQVLMYSEPLSIVVIRSIAVAAIYIILFNFIAWYSLKKAQITG